MSEPSTTSSGATRPSGGPGIPTYGEVVYRELWTGIDMVFRGANGKLKYEFVARPGADPRRDPARLPRRGDGLALGAGGQLLIATPLGTLRDEKPRTFQVVDGRRVPVESQFALGDKAGAVRLRARRVRLDPPARDRPGSSVLDVPWWGGVRGGKPCRSRPRTGACTSTGVTLLAGVPEHRRCIRSDARRLERRLRHEVRRGRVAPLRDVHRWKQP